MHSSWRQGWRQNGPGWRQSWRQPERIMGQAKLGAIMGRLSALRTPAAWSAWGGVPGIAEPQCDRERGYGRAGAHCFHRRPMRS